MKHNRKAIKYSSALLSLALLIVGCSTQSESDLCCVEFPTSINIDNASSGQQFDITFSASDTWRISGSASWIEFDYMGYTLSAISGQPSDSVTITISINDNNSSTQDDNGEVILTIGEQSQTIATITRIAQETTISLWAYNFEQEIFEPFDLESPLNLEWCQSQAAHIAKLSFSTNFAWQLSGFPSWLTTIDGSQITDEGSADQSFEQLLSTDLAAYTLDEQMSATLNITCPDNSAISYPVTITSPGAKGLMRVVESDDSGFSCIVEGSTSSVDNQIITLSYTLDENGAQTFNSSDISWITMSKGEDIDYGYLTKISRTITLEQNRGQEARQAAIFVLPLSLLESTDSAELYDSSGELKEEYAPYIVAQIEQSGTEPSPSLEFAAEPTIDATISMVTDEDLIQFYLSEFGLAEDSIYQLTYATAGSAQICFPEGVSAAGQGYLKGILSGEESPTWLSVMGGMESFTITMNSTEYSTGYIIVQNDGINIAVIHCIQRYS